VVVVEVVVVVVEKAGVAAGVLFTYFNSNETVAASHNHW
jgi:hypothetical protein